MRELNAFCLCVAPRLRHSARGCNAHDALLASGPSVGCSAGACRQQVHSAAQAHSATKRSLSHAALLGSSKEGYVAQARAASASTARREACARAAAEAMALRQQLLGLAAKGAAAERGPGAPHGGGAGGAGRAPGTQAAGGLAGAAAGAQPEPLQSPRRGAEGRARSKKGVPRGC